MPNVLKQRIESKKAMYDKLIENLNKDIAAAQKDYSGMCNDYGKELGYIRHNSNLSKEGKRAEAKTLQELYFRRVNSYGEKHLNSLIVTINAWEQLYSESNKNNDKYLIGKKLPQLIYVTSMLNSIDSPALLNEMFEYVCEEDNFSDELINLVQAKTNSMMKAYDNPRNESINTHNTYWNESINTHLNLECKPNKHEHNNQMNVIDIVRDKKVLQDIFTEINDYKTDYSRNSAEMKQRFEGWLKNKKYPTNIYLTSDEKRDFGIPSDLKESIVEQKSNDPWNR